MMFSQHCFPMQIDDVRRAAGCDDLLKPAIVCNGAVYYLCFTVNSSNDSFFLSTVRSQQPREFKTALAYIRVLKSLGIDRWTVVGADRLVVDREQV